MTRLGDFVGGGLSYSYTPADGTFSAKALPLTADGLVDRVEITFLGAGAVNWELDFRTQPTGQTMAVGIYNSGISL